MCITFLASLHHTMPKFVHTIITVITIISIITSAHVTIDTICAAAMHTRFIGAFIDICNTKIFEYKSKCAFSKCSFVCPMTVYMKQKSLKALGQLIRYI